MQWKTESYGKFQELKERQEKMKALTKKVPKTPVTITSLVVLDKTTTSAIKFNHVIKGVKQTSQQHQPSYNIFRTEDTELPALEIRKKNTIMNDPSQEIEKQTTNRVRIELEILSFHFLKSRCPAFPTTFPWLT